MKRILYMSLALVTSALALGAANASYVPANGITINEAITEPHGEYTVTNGSNAGIYAFFVGNDAEYASVSNQTLGPWNSMVQVTSEDWQKGLVFSGAKSWTPPDTTKITWLFGNAGYAVGYWSSSTPQQMGTTKIGVPIAAGTTQGGFDFSTFTMMDPKFIAFGQNGGIIGQGSVVPIPAAAWLFGSGLIGLVALARRRKA